MPYKVLIAEDAERDIEDIYRYIARNDSVANAEYVIEALERACDGLNELPERGNVPKELRRRRPTRHAEPSRTAPLAIISKQVVDGPMPRIALRSDQSHGSRTCSRGIGAF
jgi:plasmid stabilization system protein ParE